VKEKRHRERVRISNIQKGKERRRGKRGEIEGRRRERDKGEETEEDGQRGGIEVENSS
jgi:hypothetical protein